MTKSQLIRWRLRQLFAIVLSIGILYGGYRLLAMILTPEVLTLIGIVAGFLILRWIVRIVLRIAFTIFSLSLMFMENKAKKYVGLLLRDAFWRTHFWGHYRRK
ncbi:hypothetical protein QYZ87_09815 [Porphyromonadaceae bacterium W3.11]|nr:hypothetical protein [Porphyromonadaceae bacterium W3.11]